VAEARIYREVMRLRAAVRAENDAALQRLIEAYGGIYRRLVAEIRSLELEIVEAREQGLAISADWLRRRRRYAALIEQVERELGRFGAALEVELDALARAGIAAGQRDALALVGARMRGVPQVALASVWNTLPVDAVETLLGFLAEGSPLRERLSGFGADAAVRIARAMEESVGLGYSPRRLAERLRHEAGMKLTDALRMARTTQINAYRESTRAAYAANEQLVPTWTWVSALDPKGTCMGCIAQHGSVHPVSERLNDHHNGWCVMAPNPVSYRALGLDVDGPDLEAIPSGEDWFKGLGLREQMAFLPSEAARDAWREGKVRVRDFLGSHVDDVWGEIVAERGIGEILGREAR
jgi:hypothetical protein